jgi:hypothetical protein
MEICYESNRENTVTFIGKTVLVLLLPIRLRVESNVKVINSDSKVKVRQIVARLRSVNKRPIAKHKHLC